MKKQTACRAAAWLSVLCLCLGGALPAAADTQTSAVATGQTDTAAAERDDTSPIAYTEFLAEQVQPVLDRYSACLSDKQTELKV